MGRQIAVEYLVPVLCWVDIEEGEIVRVVEHGELITSTGNLVDEDGNEFGNPAEVTVATQIAEENDWPAWESP